MAHVVFFVWQHGGGVRCKLEGCNRVAIGKLQLCRAHGGGARSRPKNRSSGVVVESTMALPTAPAGTTQGVGGHI